MEHDGKSPRRIIDYLIQGSPAQRRAYRVLTELKILERLEQYDAVLVGTFPIDLVVAGSDLDIICEVHSPQAFLAHVERCFGRRPGFQVETSPAPGKNATVINFVADGLPVQIYGEPAPVLEQAAYLHMEVERRLLLLGGPGAREHVLALKHAGLKTEPAFAAWLGLSGDPYKTLLALAQLTEDELRDWYSRGRSAEERNISASVDTEETH
jgi:hypothetical protein